MGLGFLRRYYYQIIHLPRRLLRDPIFLLILAALAFSFYAWSQRKKTAKRFGETKPAANTTGHQLVQQIFKEQGVEDVKVEQSAQPFSDYYDPTTKIVGLSEEVYSGNSIAALATAAQKVSLALQDHKKYRPFRIRFRLTPLVSFLATLAIPLYAVGLFAGMYQLTKWGLRIGLFVSAFPLLTLPIEIDASQKALQLLENGKFLKDEELRLAKEFLSFEALSLVAYPAMIISNIITAIKARQTQKEAKALD
ncbi:hypothetical protein A2291_05840 [candidate division WOR-1 bacterium RIFOXYB2_FULL_42_35]|uniref:Peptidase n=1 Tax=candidate division WOR-1 bacterium RIFOXYC2_FULL_41_25 TaxID=1802586 RepID=A0A1F4TK61_UNCSA|nr:MAG: hypothetical protein A2247_02480 [candidate division WOR-1 bacterium RIFOXYA2_FULL_41_14]OGC22440.1 MAG: hypothetical protein A2291_05840 [candidate division WOR-1 bacterium RIFOXYB2_FULL_42_35]OGC33118.1 MAG: hypothetical protein A2462_08750 [candidate division WOR-1 bacterium RIFOXYC2_FULL_41_25]